MDIITWAFIGAVLVLLAVASAVVAVLRHWVDEGVDPAIVETFRGRVRAWWILFAALAAAFWLGHAVTVALFGLISFWALREFITLTPTRPADHRPLFWVFFLCVPLHYLLVAWGAYSVFSVLIPVYAFLLIPTRIVLSGDTKRFLERVAKIQAGLLICVYCLGYAPALLALDIPAPRPPEPEAAQLALDEETSERLREAGRRSDANSSLGDPSGGGEPPFGADEEVSENEVSKKSDFVANIRLLFYLVVLVQLSDAFQYAWSQIPSRHVIVPSINASRTWEGLFAGTATVTLVGTLLGLAVAYPHWWHATLVSIVVSFMACAGALTMSAIKRDRGVADYGTLVEGHYGILDRIDSLCFTAPIFYHMTCGLMGITP